MRGNSPAAGVTKKLQNNKIYHGNSEREGLQKKKKGGGFKEAKIFIRNDKRQHYKGLHQREGSGSAV